MSRARPALACLAAAAVASACAVTRSGDLDALPDFSAAAAPDPRPSVAVALAVRLTQNGARYDFERAAFPQYQSPLLESYRSSGYFREVAAGLEPRDLRAEVRVTRASSYRPVAAGFSALTLFLLPHFQEVEYAVETTFVDAAGKKIGSIAKTEKVTYFNQLFAMAIGKLSGQYDTENETYRDLQRATLVAAAQAGWLGRKETGPGGVTLRSP